MITAKDSEQLASTGIQEKQVEEQLKYLAEGFPFLEIIDSASVEKGIIVVSGEEQHEFMKVWDEYLSSGNKIVKFVPASGAASRMFKDIYAFIDADHDEPQTPFEKKFFSDISSFAFYECLNEVCLANEGKCITELIGEGKFKAIAKLLLEKQGLNYGQLPKGLLTFHSYPQAKRTALEEHLVEGAMYAKSDGKINIHFTVSPEHEPLFEKCVDEKREIYEAIASAQYNVTFSRQKPSTDTLAVDMNNNPLRNSEGRLVFRPGGHGALIENLNDLDADIVFIKNIDNVTPDRLRQPTVLYKKILAGVLVSTQKKIFEYLNILESGKYLYSQLEEMIHFLHDRMYIRHSMMKNLEDADLVIYLKNKLNRPLRVCGMVKNEGEPGGGPFIARNADGSISPQILESSQIDLNNPEMKILFDKGTHFNPVDLICAIKDYRGNKFNLPDYIDRNTGFIAIKSNAGQTLKALELPGLWNGAMSDWNTVFVEVPVETFNPVKSVADLLRSEHQG